MIIFICLLAGIVLILLWGVGIYNSLVALRNSVKASFAQIDVQLQRRYDLIPNLVEVAKKYMTHEKETMEAVIRARNAAYAAAKKTEENPSDPEAMKSLLKAEQNLGGVLGRLLAVSEAYPDLKADTQMSYLMSELTDTEDKIAFSRQSYNDAVTHYNTKTEQFPSSLIAGMFHFLPATFYQVEEESIRSAPKVDFGS